jgi:hypothetical protein
LIQAAFTVVTTVSASRSFSNTMIVTPIVRSRSSSQDTEKDRTAPPLVDSDDGLRDGRGAEGPQEI